MVAAVTVAAAGRVEQRGVATEGGEPCEGPAAGVGSEVSERCDCSMELT